MKVQLIARVEVNKGDTHTPQVAPAFWSNGRIKAGYVVIGGEETRVHAVRNYYVRWTEQGARRIQNVGSDPIGAIHAAERKDAELRAKALGIVPLSLGLPQTRVRFEDAIEKYLEEIKIHKRPKTYDAYSHALKLFQQGCKVEFVDQIGRDCVMNFKAACEKKYESAHTARNLFMYTYTFLKRHGKNTVVNPTDFPKVEHNEYDPPSDDDIRKMVAACQTETERVLVLFAHRTGFRKGEIVHAEIGDIDFAKKTIRTRSKPQWGFKTKDHEERIIAADDTLMVALKSYVENIKGELLFPREDGKPNIHLDRIMARVYKRAGVAIPHKPLHGFRVAYACSLCRAGVDVYTIQKALGHSDIETTQSYLRAVKQQDPVLRAKVNAAFD